VSAKAEEAEAEEETGDADAADVTVEEKADRKAKAVKRATDREPVEKNTPRELLEYVLAEGKKDFIVQRYKGLGEMTAEQLWSTTMNPETALCSPSNSRTLPECEGHLHPRSWVKTWSRAANSSRTTLSRKEPRHLILSGVPVLVAPFATGRARCDMDDSIRVRVSGFMVVDHNCSAVIFARPL